MSYLGFTTEEWAKARERHTEGALEAEDFSQESAIKWMLLRAAECRADGATPDQAVKQAVGEVFSS